MAATPNAWLGARLMAWLSQVLDGAGKGVSEHEARRILEQRKRGTK